MTETQSSAAELETTVRNYLETILQKYQRIDQLADRMLTSDAEITFFDEQMTQFKSERDAIMQLQQRHQSINEQYRATRPHASPAVISLTDTIGSLMQSLLMKISKLERHAKGSCEQLVPQIHEGVRALQMKSAYG